MTTVKKEKPKVKSEFSIFILPFVLAGVLAGCLGGSDGVENPKLTLDYRVDDGAAATAVRVSLYEKHRDPVIDSAPLARKTFADGKAEWTPEALDSALGGARDTTLDFNAVAVSGDREAFSAGYRYKRKGDRAGFSRLPAEAGPEEGGYGSVSETLALPKAVSGFIGKLGGQGAALGLDYVFIPGSPYHGPVAERMFLLPRLSPGVFDLVGADQDSAKFFRSADSLNTADTAFTAKTWGEITFVQ
jgi:hypothetical protein